MPWLSWLDSKKTSQPCQINLVTWQQFKWVECVLLWALGKTWDQSNNTFSLLFLPGSHQLLHGPDWGLHQPQHEWGELPALWAQHWRYRLKHGCRDFQQPCRGTAHPKHAQSDSPAAFQWLLPVHHPYWSHGGSSDMCLLRRDPGPMRNWIVKQRLFGPSSPVQGQPLDLMATPEYYSWAMPRRYFSLPQSVVQLQFLYVLLFTVMRDHEYVWPMFVCFPNWFKNN